MQRIANLAGERDDENWDFRTFLRGLDLDDQALDALVHRLNTEVSAQIDCTQCGNCCKHIKPGLDETDVSELARGLKLPVSEFKTTYVLPQVESPERREFNALPCPFLTQNRCSVYTFRPQDCRSYPHLHKDRFRSRLISVIGNYSICLIVFNVYEQLKAELWHPGQLDDDPVHYRGR